MLIDAPAIALALANIATAINIMGFRPQISENFVHRESAAALARVYTLPIHV